MRIEDINYFSKKYRFRDINWNQKDWIIKAFKDRVEGLYLKPAEELNRNKHPFATGVMCVATIDSLARIETGLSGVGKRFTIWLENNINYFANSDPDKRYPSLAARFYDEFRNGLIHEGRIKSRALFSYDVPSLMIVDNGVMVVNPSRLLEEVKTAFKKYIKEVKRNKTAFLKLKKVLKIDFDADIKQAKKTMRASSGASRSLTTHMLYAGTH